MCVVGIGGLWSIPTFHNITQLSPFLGAMCVVAILWVVNEVVNRNVNEEVMTVRRVPHALQYGTISLILFILGIMLAVEVVKETGVLRYVVAGAPYINNVWLAGGVAGVLSSVLDNFAMALSLFTVSGQQCMANDMLWRVVAYSAVMGGNVLLLGSVSGLALKGIERIHIGWYFKSVGWMVIVAWLAGLAIMWVFSLL